MRNLVGLIFSVLISDNDMSLACSHRSNSPCYFDHSLAGVISFLLEVPVFTLYLVVECIIFISKVVHLTLITDRECLQLILGIGVKQISDTRADFTDVISTIRKHVITGRIADNVFHISFSAAFSAGANCDVHFTCCKSHNNIVYFIGNAVNVYRVFRTVHDLELSACQARSTRVDVLFGLTVNLTESNAAAHYSIYIPSVQPVESVNAVSGFLLVEVMCLSVFTDCESTCPLLTGFVFRHVVASGCFCFHNFVCAVFQLVSASCCNILLSGITPFGDDRVDCLAHLIDIALVIYRGLRTVIDRIFCAGQSRIALEIALIPVIIRLGYCYTASCRSIFIRTCYMVSCYVLVRLSNICGDACCISIVA